MKAIAEIEIEVSGGRIVNNDLPDGKYKLTYEFEKCSSEFELSKTNVLVEASKLSLSDDFLAYVPKTKEEKLVMDCIKIAIQEGVEDFWSRDFVIERDGYTKWFAFMACMMKDLVDHGYSVEYVWNYISETMA